MSMNHLMAFRTTFLRAIAEAWYDSKFRSDLLGRDPITALQEKFKPYRWGWPGTCTLKILESKPLDDGSSDGEVDGPAQAGVDPVVKRECSDGERSDGPSQFQWIDDAWVYSPDLKDGLTLYLPLDGSKIEKCQRALALGDYYRQFSSLFSDHWGRELTLVAEVLLDAEAKAEALVDAIKYHTMESGIVKFDSPAPVGGFAPTDEEFSSFNVALLGAISKAWEDPSYKATLMIDAAAALSAIRDYKLPWNMKIKIADDQKAQWYGPDATRPNTYWTQGTPHILRLYFPDKPADYRAEPMALAMYNATGAEFPFTCTC